MNEKEISSEESLAIIHGMIALARNKINHNGFHFMLWGSLLIVVSLVMYGLNYSNEIMTYHWVWAMVPLIGFPIAFIYESRRSKKGRGINRFDRLYGYLWIGFGVTLTILVFISIVNGVNPIAFILSLVGLAVYISGKIYKFRPLIIGAFFVWISAIVCTYLGENNQLLLNAIAFLFGYVIPGLLLWRKNQTSV